MIDREFDVRAYEEGYRAGKHDAQIEIDRLRTALNADDQTLRLHMGEMTAQEMRTLRAGFKWVLARAALGGDK